MITRKSLAAFALASTCLAPLAARAQTPATAPAPAATPAATPAPAAVTTPFTGDIMMGLEGVMGNNPNQGGRYNGLNTAGFNFVTNFDIMNRAPWDSGGTRYYELYGNNLVFQTGNRLGTDLGSNSPWPSSVNNSLINEGSLGFHIGDQGTWEAGVDYNALTYTGNVIDSLYTVNGYQGSLNPKLVPWGGATPGHAGTTSYTIPSLTATGAMQPVQTGTRRDIVSGEGTYFYGDWSFTLAAKHEHKSGSMEESYDGAYGGMAFAMPIDYDTDRYDATAAYTTRLFQGSVQYTYSHFADNNTFVSLPFPTSNTAAPWQRTAAYSTPPSNDAQYITVLLASNAIPNTRINLNARFGVEKQDDTFPPNTADPGGANLIGANLIGLNSALQGTTADSPDITASVYQIKLTATSHPIANGDISAFYGVDGRHVTLNQFGVVSGGTGGQGADTTPGGGAANTYFVVPQDWLKQNAGAEFGYKIIPSYDTRLTIGYRFDAIDRSNAQVGSSATSTASVGVSSRLAQDLNGRLTFAYGDRTGSLSYLTPWQNLANNFVTTAPTYSGAFYQAPMTSESVTARADYAPMRSVSGDLFVQFKNENYTYPAANNFVNPLTNAITYAPLTGVGTGVKQDQALTIGPDLDWRPKDGVNVHVFYTYEMLFYDNFGNGACATSVEAATAACAGTAGYFENKQTSTTQTVGVSGDWQVNDKLKLKADYTFSYGTVMFGEFNGVFVSTPTASYQNVGNYPDIDSTMHEVRVSATYKLTENMDLIGVADFSYFHNNDWNDTANAIQGAGTSAISILTPGYSSPNWSILTLMTGVRFKL